MLKAISHELKHHAPFTLLGALSGLLILVIFAFAKVPGEVSWWLFDIFHPAHVLLSAMATSAVYRRYSNAGVISTVIVGYLGAIIIGTVSDCLIPYLGEWLLGMHDEHVHASLHIGFIEHWYIVNPLALVGVAVAYMWDNSKIPHTGHVLLSTWASLFHMLRAMSEGYIITTATVILVPIFLFLAVWAPCCTSDIIFPMMLAGKKKEHA